MSLGYLGVPIFFLISGYGISQSIENKPSPVIRFLKQRLIRIYPIYWISMAFILTEVLVIVSLGLNRYAAIPTLRQLVEGLLLLTPPDLQRLNPVYWSLTYIIHFYLLSALAIRLFRKKPFIAFDLFTIVVLLERYGVWSVGEWDRLFILRHYWLDFYCGNLIYRFLSHSWKSWEPCFSLVALAALVVLNTDLPIRFEIAPVLALLLIAIHPLDSVLSRNSVVSAFGLLGLWSYSLFLTHVMIGPKLIGITDRLTTMGNTLYLVVLTIGTLGSIAWAYLFYGWFEEPLSRRLGRKPSVQLK